MKKYNFRVVIGVLVVILIGVGQFVYNRRSAIDQNPVRQSPAVQESIELDGLQDGSRISSPLRITGRARGGWYFEASFPIILTDWDGKIIAQTHATAMSDWMTTEWVPFEATIEFPVDVTVSDRASLIFKKDNPSGEPRFDEAKELTVFLEN